jgi:hypothetical protein
VRRSWQYFLWIPTIKGFGMVPLVQWLVVPVLMMGMMKRFKIIGAKITQGGKKR